jgi:WD40 repeat protein
MTQISTNQGYEMIILPFSHPVYDARWSEDEGEIAAGGYASTIAIWQLPKPLPRLSLTIPNKKQFNLNHLLWNRDGTKLLGYDDLNGWYIWDTHTGEILCSPSQDAPTTVFSACWDTNQTRVLAAHRDSVYVWDGSTGNCLLQIPTYESMSALWSIDERMIFVSGYDFPRAYDATTGEPIFVVEMEASESAVHIKTSADGKMLLASGNERSNLGPLAIWDAQTGRKIFTLPKVGRSGVWGPDNTKILLYSSKPTTEVFQLSLFDLTAQRIIQTFDHHDMVFRAFLDKAGTRVISYGRNMRIFEAESGKTLLTIQSPAYVRHACFNADETKLLTTGDDGTIRVWDLQKLLESSVG